MLSSVPKCVYFPELENCNPSLVQVKIDKLLELRKLREFSSSSLSIPSSSNSQDKEALSPSDTARTPDTGLLYETFRIN